MAPRSVLPRRATFRASAAGPAAAGERKPACLLRGRAAGRQLARPRGDDGRSDSAAGLWPPRRPGTAAACWAGPLKSCMAADGRALRMRVCGVDCRFRRQTRQRESIILPTLTIVCLIPDAVPGPRTRAESHRFPRCVRPSRHRHDEADLAEPSAQAMESRSGSRGPLPTHEACSRLRARAGAEGRPSQGVGRERAPEKPRLTTQPPEPVRRISGSELPPGSERAVPRRPNGPGAILFVFKALLRPQHGPYLKVPSCALPGLFQLFNSRIIFEVSSSSFRMPILPHQMSVFEALLRPLRD